MKKKYYPFLLYNERIRDFIRWDELFFRIIMIVICVLWFGWWGILLAGILSWLLHLEGGPVGDIRGYYPKEKRIKQSCSDGIENCRFCGNGYEHSFNENYQKSLKWWEKVL